MGQEIDESATPGIWCVRNAYREYFRWPLIRASLGIMAASLLIFAVLGPLGMEDRMGALQRLAFVTFCGVLCWPVCHALSGATLYVGRSLAPIQILLAFVAGTLFTALPCTAVVLMAFGLFRAGADIDFTLSEVYLNTAVAALACRGVVFYVACQRAKVTLAAERGSSPVVPDRATAAARAVAALPGPVGDSREALFERLPGMLGRDIVYISVSGHYLNVLTTEGSCLILMRLADAVVSLGELGIQVHRSYWVAHRHIVAVQRLDGRMMLRLTGGHEVPVSRTYRAAVNAAVSKARDQGA